MRPRKDGVDEREGPLKFRIRDADCRMLIPHKWDVCWFVLFLVAAARAEVPQVKVIAGGESKTNADACRGIWLGRV